MPLQTSGLMSLSNVRNEFGITFNALSTLYSVAAGVPTSGLIGYSNMYGKGASVPAFGAQPGTQVLESTSGASSNLTVSSAFSLTDAYGAPLTYTSVSAPANVTASVDSSNGLISYSVGAGVTTSGNIVVSVTNRFAKSSNVSVPVNVGQKPTAASSGSIANVTTGNFTLDVASLFSNPSAASLTYAVVSNPNANASVSGSTLTVVGNNRGATYNVTVSASNAFGVTSGTATVAVTESSSGTTWSTVVANYPPADMTANSTVLNAATYIASGSSTYGAPQYDYFRGFDGSSGWWASGASLYNATTGAYTGAVTTTCSGTAVTGEYIQIHLPTSIQPMAYMLSNLPQAQGTNFTPNNWVLAGSPDGTTWTTLDTQVSTTWAQSYMITVSSSSTYSYYRMIFQSNRGNNWVAIDSLTLQGGTVVAVTASGPIYYPPADMTANTTAMSGVAGGVYVVSGSTVYALPTYDFFHAFDGNTAWWACYGTRYNNTTTGAYTGAVTTTCSGATVYGEYIQIQLPAAVTISAYALTNIPLANGSNSAPKSWVLAGSPNASTWTTIDTQVNTTWAQTHNIAVSPSSAYSYYRMIVQTNRVNDWMGFDRLTLQSGTSSNVALPLTPAMKLVAGAGLTFAAGTSNVTTWLPTATGSTGAMFAQATTAYQPTYYNTGGGATGNLPYLYFNSAGNQYLQNSNLFNLDMFSGGGYTLLTYVRYLTVTDVTPRLFAASGTGSWVEFGRNGTNGISTTIGQVGGAMNATTGSAPYNQWVLQAARYSSATKNFDVFWNTRANKYTTSPTTALTLNNVWGSTAYIARSLSGTDTYMNMHLNFLALYDRPLSDAELDVVLSSATMYSGITSNAEAQVFPPIDLTANSSTVTALYGAGTYTLSGSGINGSGYDYFNGYNGSNAWYASLGAKYSTSTGAYAGTATTTSSGVTVSGEYAQIALPVATLLSSYVLTVPPQTSVGITPAPKTWVLAGSPDGTTWTTIDTQANGSIAYASAYSINVVPAATYSYYRLIITSNRGAGGLGDWSGFDRLSLIGTQLQEYPPPLSIGYGNTWTKLLSNTVLGVDGTTQYAKYAYTVFNSFYGNGTYTAWANSIWTYSATTGYNSDEWPPSGAFDKRVAQSVTQSGWLTAGVLYTNAADAATPPILTIQLPVTVTLKRYSIGIRSECCTQIAPNKWALQGSTNNTAWTTIDSQSGISGWALGETKTYNIMANTATYSYYRIIVYRNNATTADNISIGELRLYAA